MEQVAKLLNDMVEAGVLADYAVIALSVGRAKDFARILALREAGAATDGQIAGLASRHGLAPAWGTFLKRFNEN